MSRSPSRRILATMVLVLVWCRGVGAVADLARFPQDLTVYSRTVDLAMSPQEQQQRYQLYRERFFAPWNRTEPSMSAQDFADLLPPEPRGWAENLNPWSQERWDQVRAQARIDDYPSLSLRAVTVKTSTLRGAPTASPRFGDPRQPGQGWPFDLWVQTRLLPGMPLLITHRSLNDAWYFVESPLASGWIEAQDLALVDDDLCRSWQSLPLAVVRRDGVSLRDQEGRFLALAHLGTVLPLEDRDLFNVTLLAPVADGSGQVQLRPVTLDCRNADAMPLELTSRNLARAGNVMMGQPYSWGGNGENRDCSLMLHDLFSLFGLWLPRNSRWQSRSGDFRDLSDLKPQAKERAILAEGKPFLTLIWMPGHIGLYLGSWGGRAVMFHDFWGVRTLREGQEDRLVVGQVAVTSLTVGAEVPDAASPWGLLERIGGITLLN